MDIKTKSRIQTSEYNEPQQEVQFETSSLGQLQKNSFKHTFHAYLELTKPKVVAMLMVTALAGMHLATDASIPLPLLLWSTLGLTLGMSGAAAINHLADQRADAKMHRTRNRPLVQGNVSTRNALIFAIGLCLSSIVILDTFVNRLTCVLTIGGMAGYALIYTMYLKRATPQNIVIGGLSGALPPLLGWTSITNEVHPHALLLVLLIFVWTPPHFWALAIHRRDDYAKADVPMLPVTHGIEFTKTQIILYCVMLLVTSFLPYLSGMSGFLYLSVATVSGLIFLGYAVKLKYKPTPKLAMQTFGFSIVYLLLVFPALLIDHSMQL